MATRERDELLARLRGRYTAATGIEKTTIAVEFTEISALRGGRVFWMAEGSGR